MKINDYLSVKVVDDKCVIHVNDEPFKQCTYVLLTLPSSEAANPRLADNIDDLAEKYSKRHEHEHSLIDAETELFVHASNLQAWYEHEYDTRILHSNLAFPLLKKLTEAGDPKAKRVFKDEICYRYKASENVAKYLITEGYLDHLSPEELASLWEERPLLNPYFIKRLMPTQQALIPLLIIHSTYCTALRKSRKLPTVRKLLIDAFRKMIKAKKITLKRIGK